jgi:hypothetical protein
MNMRQIIIKVAVSAAITGAFAIAPKPAAAIVGTAKDGTLECTGTATADATLTFKFVQRGQPCDTGTLAFPAPPPLTAPPASVSVNVLAGQTCATILAAASMALGKPVLGSPPGYVAPFCQPGLQFVRYPSSQGNGVNGIDFLGFDLTACGPPGAADDNNDKWDLCIANTGASSSNGGIFHPSPNADTPFERQISVVIPKPPYIDVPGITFISRSVDKKKRAVPALPPVGVGLLGLALASAGGLLLRRKRAAAQG